jgi:Polyketide cyclase / dehydrase and lipid transport
MRSRFFKAAVLAALLANGGALAAEYTHIVLEKDVDASADTVWKKVGGFCALIEWFKIPDCTLISGSGDIGTVRSLLGGQVTEVMIMKGEYSYGYAFPNPNPTYYHGNLSVLPQGVNKSKIVYRLLYDQESLGMPEAKAKNRESRVKRFMEALENMKTMSEAK